MMFVMRCNPQHYYLLHEIGHRLGMPHATIYKLLSDNSSTNSQPAQVRRCRWISQGSLVTLSFT
jgi:predicted DNA-binding transcriptional regulator AlpA